MKRRSILAAVVFVICLLVTNICFFSETVSAKEITSVSQVKKLAKKQVKGARIVDIEEDDEKGQLVYDVELSKGKKEYKLVYRASDAKLVSYEWELKSRYVKRGKGKLIGEAKAQEKAQKQAKKAEITSIAKKRSSGVDVYKVKMNDGSKKYEVKIHARTGAVLEYEWDLIVKSNANKAKADSQNKDNKSKKDNKDKVVTKEYIGEDAAKQIALDDVGGGMVVKCKLDVDDGVAVYEVEVINGSYEYEIDINAETGVILKVEREYKPELDPSVNEPGSDEYIGIEAAKQIALEKTGAGTVVKSKLDEEDGQMVYEIEIIKGEFEYEMEIDAITGEILKYEKESIYD